MKYTLLELTQDILNDLDSDEVNSISDTVESQQVAQILKTCFNELISNRNWPHLQKLVQMEASADVTKPNYLITPLGMKELVFFKYDCKKFGSTKVELKDIIYKYPDEFLRFVSGRNSDMDNVVEVIDYSGSTILTYNNSAPTYWTSFDDKHIVTDSYDSSIDDTLKKAKTQCLACIEPVWVHTDSAIPNLPEEAFAGYLEEAKSTAFLVLKQMNNQKAEQKAARQGRWLSRKVWAAHGGVRYENYGRKGRR